MTACLSKACLYHCCNLPFDPAVCCGFSLLLSLFQTMRDLDDCAAVWQPGPAALHYSCWIPHHVAFSLLVLANQMYFLYIPCCYLRCHLEVLVHGSVTRDEAQALAQSVQSALGPGCSQSADVRVRDVCTVIPQGSNLLHTQVCGHTGSVRVSSSKMPGFGAEAVVQHCGLELRVQMEIRMRRLGW
jgi:hypothetical protein